LEDRAVPLVAAGVDQREVQPEIDTRGAGDGARLDQAEMLDAIGGDVERRRVRDQPESQGREIRVENSLLEAVVGDFRRQTEEQRIDDDEIHE
jgi:hypothetical protein